MSHAARLAVTSLREILDHPAGGINAAVADIAEAGAYELPLFSSGACGGPDVPADLVDRTGLSSYPGLHVYCATANNSMREKFRTFSGVVGLVIEVRVSHDRLEQVSDLLYTYAEAVTHVLGRSRGEWRPGVFYSGGYDVAFAPVKRGGKNFLQAAKINLDVNVSL